MAHKAQKRVEQSAGSKNMLEYMRDLFVLSSVAKFFTQQMRLFMTVTS